MCKNYVDLKSKDYLIDNIFFEVIKEDRTETIKMWRNDEGKYFVFLPSYADLEKTHISLKKWAGTNIYLDGNRIADGGALKKVELSKIYTLSLDNSNDTYQVQFLQSANIASMYVNTQSGTMERIYADKNNKEKASIALYTSDGSLNYIGKQYDEKIKCRGNSTFGADKKPFLIELKNSSDLLGMGSAKKWVLLANSYDPTNLRNKLIFDFAKKTSLKWTPDCEYVDLYLNGEYNGLYLLCEKVEIGENRLDIDPDNGFLFKLTRQNKVYPGDNAFKMQKNRIIKIEYPGNCSKKRVGDLYDKMSLVENLILSDDTEKVLFENIDIKTWVIRYLIDEVFQNIDAEEDSCYFYWNGRGKIYAGPIWDYDLSAYDTEKYGIYTMQRSCKDWYAGLDKKDLFRNTVKEIYKEQFKGELSYIGVYIDELSRFISQAVFINSVRWNNYDYQSQCEEYKQFLVQRKEFLEEYWFSGDKYFDIKLVKMPDIIGNEAYYTVKKGDTFVPSKSNLNIEWYKNDVTWIDAATQKKYDSQEPIAGDKLIYATLSEMTQTERVAILQNFVTQSLHIVFIIIFMLFLAVLIAISIKIEKNQQRRRDK